MLEIWGPLPADPVGVAVICRLHIAKWRHFSGSFSANNPYLLKSGRSAVFDGEICRYMRDTVWRMVRQNRFFFKLTIWRHNMLIIIRQGFFKIILTFNLELDTIFFWGGGSNKFFESFYIFYWNLRINFTACAL